MPAKRGIRCDPTIIAAKGKARCCPSCDRPGTLLPVGTPVVKNGVLKTFIPEAFLCTSCNDLHRVEDLGYAKLEAPAPLPVAG